MTEKVFAPFTSVQVYHLTQFQVAGAMHPFTCPHLNHSNSVAVRTPTLIATEAGWYCPTRDCDYTQNWAHGFMADGSFLKHHRATVGKLLEAAEDTEDAARLTRIQDTLFPGRREEDITAMQKAVDEVKRLAEVQTMPDDALELQAASDDALELALKRWPEINA